MNEVSVLLPVAIRASTLASEIRCELIGPDRDISSVSSVQESITSSLGFARIGMDPLVQERFLASGGVLISNGEVRPTGGVSIILSEDPEYSFARALEYLFNYRERLRSAFIKIHHPDDIFKQRYVEHFREFDIMVGANSVLQPGVVIGPSVKIGDDCLIQSGAVIGGPGFGSFMNAQGKNTHLPHVGGVILGNNVEIGALTTVCSGTLRPVILEDSVHIDDHVHVGHNCRIGAGTVITAGCIISGRVVIGKNSWLGIGTLIRENLTIADNVFLGMGSLVTKNCEVPGRYMGSPARFVS